MPEFYVIPVDGVLTAFSAEEVVKEDQRFSVTYWTRSGHASDSFSYWERVFLCDPEQGLSSHFRSRFRRGVGRRLSVGHDDLSLLSPDDSPFFTLVSEFIRTGVLSGGRAVQATDACAALESVRLQNISVTSAA